MTFIKNRIYCRLFNLTFLIAIFFSVTSCELEDSNISSSDLEVYVSGTLSGNPRSGLRVTVFGSRSDAKDEVNAVTLTQITDNNGLVFFKNLDSGFSYWVRVDAILIRNIISTDNLDEGFNEMSIKIL
ncbi:hypothetical protein K8354_05130 [Polaribacter litorisediminis]|uniref:hypothetical protein n=1 Tax=Polaribacter litorisediminis TaxID=1908341 RepID=UPI001CBF5AAF|nr:hypothetical protein [Polaribacter litorisediminis]UAM99208.1 hypothetical protein K8354_05130 [Polaribacter litorisediminis]